MKKTKLNLTVVGMQYRMTKQLRFELNEVSPFKIKVEREPENTHDENAISVAINEKGVPGHPMKIGYLRRVVAAELAPEMDEGHLTITKARLLEVDIDEGTAEAEIWLEHRKQFPLDKIAEHGKLPEAAS